MTTIRQAIDREAILRKMRPKLRVFVKTGTGTYAATSSGNTVIYCPSCHAPMVDSSSGRKNHVRISPRCQGAV